MLDKPKKNLQKQRKNIETSGRDAWNILLKRTNLWALAIGVLIGSALGAVVNSLANDIIMQAIAKLTGFQSVETMSAGTTRWDPNTGLPLNGIRYGKFLAASLSFLIISFFLFSITFMVLFIWRNIIRKRKEKIIEPTIDELILAELKKINATNTHILKQQQELLDKKHLPK